MNQKDYFFFNFKVSTVNAQQLFWGKTDQIHNTVVLTQSSSKKVNQSIDQSTNQKLNEVESKVIKDDLFYGV